MGSIVASPLPVNKLDVLGPKQRPSWKHWLISVFAICTEQSDGIAWQSNCECLAKQLRIKCWHCLAKQLRTKCWHCDKAIVAPAFALAKYPTLLVVAESAPLLGQRNMLKETNVARIIQISFLTHSLAPLSHPLTDNPMQNWPNLVAPSKLPTRCSLMLLEYLKQWIWASPVISVDSFGSAKSTNCRSFSAL